MTTSSRNHGSIDGDVVATQQLVEDNRRLRERLELAERAEQELADSQSHYRSVVEAMAEGIVLQDQHGSILACNVAAERILGLTQDQMMGRSSLDPRWRAVREDGSEYPGSEHPSMVSLRTGKPVRGAVMGVHKPSGELTWISINSEPMDLSGGRRAVVASFTDITQHRAAQGDLERSQQRLRVALRAAKVGIWEWDLASDELHWTEEVYDLFELPRGGRVTFQAYMEGIDERDRDSVQHTVQAALRGENDGAFSIEHRVAGSQPEPRWVRGMGEVVRDRGGQPVRMCGAVTDVTEERQLQRRALQSQRMESIGRLAGGIAHDFNNLLTAMLGAVAEGRALAQGNGDIEGALGTIDSAASHAAQLTKQLLAFARRQVLALEPCDLDALLLDTRELLRHLLNEDIELSVHTGAQPWRARLDPTQMQQVVVNLAANARDAMPKGGRLEISVCRLPTGDRRVPAACGEGDWLRVQVRDEGEGMSPEVLDRVFEPFFTTKESGTGLGLATCYGIIEQCGGRIECSSTVGEGTTFSIFLPRYEGAPREEPPPVSSSNEGRAATVLVVEDQAPVLKVVERSLTRSGFEVLAAADPEEGLRLLQEHGGKVDLLLTDVVMPQMSGPELAMKARSTAPDLKVMFMSGYSGESVSEDVGELTNAAVVEKPFRPAELVSRIRQLLDGG